MAEQGLQQRHPTLDFARAQKVDKTDQAATAEVQQVADFVPKPNKVLTTCDSPNRVNLAGTLCGT